MNNMQYGAYAHLVTVNYAKAEAEDEILTGNILMTNMPAPAAKLEAGAYGKEILLFTPTLDADYVRENFGIILKGGVA